MQLLVLDADVLCSAILLPEGPARKLLVLAAYGAVSQYLDTQLKQELELLEEVAAAGGRVGGEPAANAERQKRRRRALKRALPPGAPDDVCLVGHDILFEDAMKCVRQQSKDNPALWTGLETAAHRRLVDATYDVVRRPPPASALERLARTGVSLVKILVGSGGVDANHPPVHAARSRSALLLTRSPLLPRFRAVVDAQNFDDYVAAGPWGDGFRLDDVDGRLLDDPDVWG